MPLKSRLAVAKDTGAALDWVPASGSWKSAGDIFNFTTEFNDPIQGSLGDCWLIAALSAMAWVNSLCVVSQTRETAASQTEEDTHEIGVNYITLYSKMGGRDAPTAGVQVSEKVCIYQWGSIMYFSSSNYGEMWPSIYEKAFAKWSTSATTDCPDMGILNGEDPVQAMCQLMNCTPVYYNTQTRTPDDIYSIIKTCCINQESVIPMTAWTYATGDFSGSDQAS